MVKRYAFDGMALALFRKTKGWSQGDLARVAGIGRSSVFFYEQGRCPQLTVAKRIADALGIRVTDLLETVTEESDGYDVDTDDR